MDGAKGKNGVESEPESLSWVALALNRHTLDAGDAPRRKDWHYPRLSSGL